MIRVLVKVPANDYWLEENVAWLMSGQKRFRGKHGRWESSWFVATMGLAKEFKDELESRYRGVSVVIDRKKKQDA